MLRVGRELNATICVAEELGLELNHPLKLRYVIEAKALRTLNKEMCKRKCKHLYIHCFTCGKEFNNFVSGVQYKSTIKGVLEFCSDECCRDYLKKSMKFPKEQR